MTNKKLFRVLILAAFAAMIVIAPLQAAQGCQKQGDQKKMMGHGCMAGQGCMMLKNIPDLSEEQKAKLEKLHAGHQKLTAAARADMEKLHAEMQGLMKDPVDAKKAEAMIDKAMQMKAAMMKKSLAHRLEVRALLTPEQKAKLGDMGCGMGCGMGGAMMHGHGCCKMKAEKKAGDCCKMKAEKKAGDCCKMKKEMKTDHGACQKAAEEKK